MTANGEGRSATPTFEIRLMAADGGMVMIHLTVCETAQEAEARACAIDGVAYDRYEIWESGRKAASGTNPRAAAL